MQTVTLAQLQSQAVEVVSSTWTRDSHDLFDFEAHHLHTHKFAVPSSSVFVLNGTNVLMHGERELPPPQGDPLLRLVQRHGSFWVDRASTMAASNHKKLWLVVRGLASGHRLVEGDVLKLGRFKFRVRQLVASATEGQQPELRLPEEQGTVCAAGGGGGAREDAAAGGTSGATAATDTELSCKNCCRICLLEGSTEDDPLITPCNCKGSIEHVHLGCLRHWIQGRLNLADVPGGSYFYRPLACELCKGPYPTYVQHGRERQPLVEVPRTEPPFIVLENIIRDPQRQTTRGLHVISLADKGLKLGRSHESDIRIADVSISRLHATIQFTKGHFVLEDNNSKFGTLVAMKKPRLLEPGSTISIQMGRTVMSLRAAAATLTTSAVSAAGGAAAAATGEVPEAAESTGGLQAETKQQLAATSANSARGERALRLSLLTRGSWGESTSGLSPPGGWPDFLGLGFGRATTASAAAAPPPPCPGGQQQDAEHAALERLEQEPHQPHPVT